MWQVPHRCWRVQFTATSSRKRAARVIEAVVASGSVKIEVNQRYPLKDAAKAHRDLHDRKTTGSTVFTV